VNVNADATGVLTVVQETQSLSGICYTLTAKPSGAPAVIADVNPMSKAMATLASVKDGTGLGKVQVTNADGSKKALVAASVSAADKNAAAQSLAQFTQISAGMPKDGSRKAPAAISSNGASSFDASSPSRISFGVSFAAGAALYHEGEDAPVKVGLRSPATLQGAASFFTASVGQDIAVAFGDFFNWLKTTFDQVESFVVQEVNGFVHFFAKIAGQIYDAVLDCIHAVVSAVEFVLNKIEVAFEDLIKWLGFIFEWGDIVNTHKVIKNILKQVANRAVTQIQTLENDVKTAFEGIEQELDAWANIPSVPDPVGTYQSNSSNVPGFGSPQSNWAMSQMKSNVSDATTTASGSNSVTGVMEQMLNDLEGMAKAELTDLTNVIQRIQTDVIANVASLSPTDILKKIVAILTDAILTTAENLIVTALDLLKLVIEGMVDLLDAPISIPILSNIYQDIAGSELSFLDLACLVVAIPATIIYKLVAGKAPFSPSDSQALSAAKDYASLQTLFAPPKAAVAKAAPAAFFAVAAAAAPSISDEIPTDPSMNSEALIVATIVSNFVALIGSLGVIAMSVIKRGFNETQTTPVHIQVLAATFYLPYVMPDLMGGFRSTPGAWSTVMNDVITCVAFGKTCADNNAFLAKQTSWANYASPVLESLINLLWFVPAGAGFKGSPQQASDCFGLAANCLFDLGGVITPLAEPKIMPIPPVADVAFLAIQGLNFGYGLLSMCAGADLAILKSIGKTPSGIASV
jgi:hypothetical protein